MGPTRTQKPSHVQELSSNKHKNQGVSEPEEFKPMLNSSAATWQGQWNRAESEEYEPLAKVFRGYLDQEAKPIAKQSNTMRWLSKRIARLRVG